MNRHGAYLLLVLFFCGPSFSADTGIVDASVCDVLADPRAFDAKLIRIKAATVVAGFDEFVIEGGGCNPPAAIWLAYPEGTKGKAGPAAVVRLQPARNSAFLSEAATRVAPTLQRNGDFKRFDSLLSAPYKSSVPCLGCARYTVTATLVGRLDGVSTAGVARDQGGKPTGLTGFGNLNLYNARLVLQAVSDVVQQEVSYPGSSRAARGDSRRTQRGTPDQVRRAAAAFGEEGEENGVEVGFGIPNEVPPDEGLKGTADSPDGILFQVTFNTDRLGKQMLSQAIAHMGAHIADVPSGSALGRPDDVESQAWQVTFGDQ